MKKYYHSIVVLLYTALAYGQVTGSSEVGITEGQLSVSLTGAATYYIPIAVPPGINGVVPKISLSYSSQSGNGMAGYGWNISGVSSISRIPSTQFHDGIIDPVDYDEFDRFALDGQRLIVKSGTSGVYGADGTQYETENFSNLKITSVGVNSNGANYGPASFKVEYPDGSFALYGAADTYSTTKNQYGISYWQNPQGVRISYVYEIYEGILYPSMIAYGTRFEEEGINNIFFDYGPRQRVEQAYVGGFNNNLTGILSKIRIRGNNTAFRNYELHHEPTSLGYDKLKYITEKTGDDSLSYNSTVFEYDTTPETISYSPITASLNYTDVSQLNSATISGDFDGDSKMDFVLYPITGTDANKKFNLFKDIGASTTNTAYPVYTGEFKNIFASTWLTADNKVASRQGITIAKTTTNDIVYETYAYGSIGVELVYTKTITMPTFQRRDGCTNSSSTNNCVQQYTSSPTSPTNLKNYSGDFNGDGITDVIVIYNKPGDIYCKTCHTPMIEGGCETVGECYETYESINSTTKASFIDLKTDSTTSFFDPVTVDPIYSTTRIEVADFNGDGKSDLYIINTGSVKIYTLNNNNQLNMLCSLPSTGITTNWQILFGDYNGDGKTDFIIPKDYGNNYTKFTSTGVNFIKEDVVYDIPVNHSIGGTCPELSIIIPNDFNSDGKTDLILIRTKACPNPEEGIIAVRNYRNMGSNFVSDLYATTGILSNIGAYAVPIFLNSDRPNSNLEINFITKSTIFKFQSSKDSSIDTLLKSVTTGNGVKETITYKPLKNETCDYNCNSVYYDSGNTENYPNMDIIVAPSFKVVTQIDKQSNTVHKKQQFMYYGAVSNFEGLGFLGFRATMRTNWTDVAGTNLISTISKNNLGLRGANDTNYSVLGFELPQNLIPTSNFITKTINTYNIDNTTGAFEEPLQTNKVFKLKNTKTEQFNGLELTSAVTTTEYDAVNDPTQSITQLKNGATIVQTTVSTIGYVPATISPTYVVGRPASMTNTITLTANQDVSTTEELYAYQDHLLTQVQKRSTNSVQTSLYVTESNIYDDWGNITKKTISYPGLQPRVTDYEYDPMTHRFLIKSYDIEHLATEFTYDMSSGVLLTEKLPCTTGDLTTIYEYDKWFKKKKIIDYLGKEKRIFYQSGGTYTRIKTEADDDSESFEIFDDLGRKIRSGYKNINGIFSHVDYLYDIYDRNYKTSEPYLASDSASQWSETFYDGYGRVTQGKSFTGKTVTYAYSGLSTTMSENTTSGNPATTTTNKTKVSVKNAIGQVVSNTESTPMGAIGTIAYSYFANGGLNTTTFDGNVTRILQDEWGRKKSLDDTSAGLYEYSYNGFGETLTEVTPNGTTTYTLDDYGKVTVKAINGNLTNSTATNTYDPTTKLLVGTEFKDFDSNPAQPTTTNYTYAYDPYNRLRKTTENAPQALFERETTFDDFGRSLTENYKAQNISDGKFSEKKVKNTYLKGFHWQILEYGTDKLLWETDLVNARGQLVTAQYGTLDGGTSALGVESHEYDDFGLPKKTSFRTQNGTNANQNPFMTLATTFSAQRGNLLSRNYSFYGAEENFFYDDLDRLTVCPSPLGAPAGSRSGTTQIYDNKGRILFNELGEYKYDSAKPYRSTGLKITDPNVTTYYNARTPQIIAYNAFKRPVTIDELNQEKITFEYNANNERSVMYYGDYQADKNLRKFRKFYSADGSMEIKRNVATGAVEFLTYIGGDGYSAPIVVKSDGATQNYLYLHRDYQGTIVAISDGTGQVLEQRHFDAWGSLIKFANSTGTTIPTIAGLMLLDRGYTGHEHLLGVGLINMNARLYDPKLHRFLSPDNYVQDPSNTQSFNRYIYCLNNPLKYSDYSGEDWWSDNRNTFIVVVACVATAVIIAASMGTATPLVVGFWAGAGAGFVGGSLSAALGGGSFVDIAVGGAFGAGYGAVAGFAGAAAALAAPAGAFFGALYGGTTNFAITGMMNVMQGRPAYEGAGLSIAIGMVTGGITGYRMASARGLNPWTGGPKNTVISTHIGTKIDTNAKAAIKSMRAKAQPTTEANTVLPSDGGVVDVSANPGFGIQSGLLDEMPSDGLNYHGNDLRSTKPTWGYKLYDNDGTFLKNGITNKPIPETRYSRAFMFDKSMPIKIQFQTRIEAYQWEYQQNLIQRGPLNLNMH